MNGFNEFQINSQNETMQGFNDHFIAALMVAAGLACAGGGLTLSQSSRFQLLGSMPAVLKLAKSSRGLNLLDYYLCCQGISIDDDAPVVDDTMFPLKDEVRADLRHLYLSLPQPLRNWLNTLTHDEKCMRVLWPIPQYPLTLKDPYTLVLTTYRRAFTSAGILRDKAFECAQLLAREKRIPLAINAVILRSFCEVSYAAYN